MRHTRRMFLSSLSVALVALGLSTPNVSAAGFTDTIFLVDESGSMAGEHAWLGNMITDLESALQAAGVGTTDGPNQYALVGFGTGSHGGGGSQVPHKHSVGGGDWGSAAQLSSATGGLIVSGGLEDGWRAIDFALNNYSFRAGAAINFVLVTDEDRDNTIALTKAGVINSLTSNGVILNAVVNAQLRDGSNAVALGIDGDGNAYTADGSGGFNTAAGGHAVGGFGTTVSDYVDVATATSGAAWDLNQLRAGGLTATSFTAAFVDIKVEEIIKIVPEPTIASLMGGLALTSFVFGLRRRRKA